MVKPNKTERCDRHIFRAARASCMPVLVPRARRSLGTFQKPKSLFWAPPVYKDLSTRYDWPVKNATVDLSASQTESVRLKDRRRQRGNVHALFLLPFQSLVITFLGICELLIKGSSFTFRSLPPVRVLCSFPSLPSRASRLFYAPHSTSFPGSSLAHPSCKRGPGKRGWLPTKPLACVAGAWKQWTQERTGPREGDTRGEREQRRF